MGQLAVVSSCSCARTGEGRPGRCVIDLSMRQEQAAGCELSANPAPPYREGTGPQTDVPGGPPVRWKSDYQRSDCGVL